jgi:hypothetical protein
MTITNQEHEQVLSSFEVNHRQQQHPEAIIPSMNSAVDYNNQGIEYLAMGLHHLALKSFKLAAQMMYSTTQILSRTTIKLQNNNSNEIRPIDQNYKVISTSNAFIRCTPVFLHHTSKPTTSCTIESATILLNMALCYHLNSISPYPFPDAMSNALALYEMAYTLSTQCHYDNRRYHIILISLNNLGQLTHDVGDFETSKRYFDELSSRVILLGSSDVANTIGKRQEFVLNALVLQNPSRCAGAA